MNYFIAREGWPFVGAALAAFIISVTIGSVFVIAPVLLMVIFVAWFFRNPEREAPEGVGAVVSPADGRVIEVENCNDGGTKISIFMSVFNVHVNRIPATGTIKKIEYNKGKFLVASRDKASLENEQNTVTMEDEAGRTIKFTQIAGLVARRIVCYLNEGDKVRRGQRFGMIRFGSRVDVCLPTGFSLRIKTGDHVKAGETILCVYE